MSKTPPSPHSLILTLAGLMQVPALGGASVFSTAQVATLLRGIVDLSDEAKAQKLAETLDRINEETNYFVSPHIWEDLLEAISDEPSESEETDVLDAE